MPLRFDYVKYDEEATETQAAFKSIFIDVLKLILAIDAKRPIPGRAVMLALTSLEETYMWIGKAIRDDQILRNEFVEERKDG